MRIHKALLAAGLTFGLMMTGSVTTASAITLTPDTLLGHSTLGNSGDEVSALESLLSLTPGSLVQDTKVNGVLPVYDSVSGLYYYDINPATPGYFIIKIGAGGTPYDTHYFFENIGELDKLVFGVAQIPALFGATCNNCNIGRLSHYVTSSVAAVPVPAALPLAAGGLAFLGMIGLRRRHLETVSA